MRILSIVGRSGAGKTTLLVRLIPRLLEQGLRVAALKHSHHGRIEVDRAGKDSHRLRQAGAQAVLLLSRGQLIQIEDRVEPPSVEDLEARLPGYDLLLVESWKSATFPSLEVVGDSGERIEADFGGQRLALVTDTDTDSELPRFRRDEIDALATFVATWLAKS